MKKSTKKKKVNKKKDLWEQYYRITKWAEETPKTYKVKYRPDAYNYMKEFSSNSRGDWTGKI